MFKTFSKITKELINKLIMIQKYYNFAINFVKYSYIINLRMFTSRKHMGT